MCHLLCSTALRLVILCWFCFFFTEPFACLPTSPCMNGGSCYDDRDENYYCECPTGFTGTNCENSEYCWFQCPGLSTKCFVMLQINNCWLILILTVHWTSTLCKLWRTLDNREVEMHAYSAFCLTCGVEINIAPMEICTPTVKQNAEYACI